MSDSNAPQAWLQVFITEALAPERFDALVSRVNTFIADAVMEVSDDREMQRDLDASTRDQSRAFLAFLIGESTTVEPPVAAHDLARTVARKGYDLRVLMQIYRAGHKATVKYIAETAGARISDPVQQPTVLLRLWENASEWLNASLEILIDTYSRERENGLHGAFARRVETVHEVLRGSASDAGEVSGRLGYPVQWTHTALVLWFDQGSPVAAADPIGMLEAAARSVGATLGDAHVLTVPSGSRGVWGWVAGPATADPALLEGFQRLARDTDIRVAVGDPAPGIAGFCSSHREAVAARRVAEDRGEVGRLVRYADVEIAYIMDVNRCAATTLVRRELRGIDGMDAGTVQLRRTLRSYLAADRNHEVAARELGVHKNTVRYRVQRAEDLLGHPIGRSRLKLELALEYLHAHGEGVLNDASC